VLAGWWLAIGYAIAGIICFILIITIPFGIASFRIANYALWPFGRTIIHNPRAGAPSVIGNIIWLIVAGIWLAIGNLVAGVALCITIIGIPLAAHADSGVPGTPRSSCRPKRLRVRDVPGPSNWPCGGRLAPTDTYQR
jgi:uncharacterized membrane protein YccF (DUF307 family)